MAVEDPSLVENRPASMARMILDRVAETPTREALRGRVDGHWESLTWGEVGDQVRAIAAGLLSLGIAPEQRVAIIAGTSVDWILADFGILCAGAATTTVYPTTPAQDVAYILSDSGSRVAFAEDADQVAKLREQRANLPDLMTIVTFDDAGASADESAGWVITLADLQARGREHLATDPKAVEDVVAKIGPEDLATLIYTSGTTGRPKGVRLAHDCWTYEGLAIQALGILEPDDVQYLWLPLSHSFGKVLLSGQLAIGFCSAVDGEVPRIVENLAVVRPTFMAAAPRIFEKVQHRVVSNVEEEGGLKKRIFDWAIGVGRRVSILQREGKQPSGLLAVQHRVADKLVFTKLKARFGGQLKYFVSGSASLSTEVAEFFHAAGILILEGYGLTESSAASFVNRPDRYRFGTVGLPLPGTRVRIAEDGEICIGGPGIMRGYHNMPDETAAALDSDGWLRTGDMGELDSAGFLRITDRKKDLIKTSHGKYVAPQSIEVIFKGVCPYASAIVVVGDGRNYCTALIALEEEAMTSWAEQNGLGGVPYAGLTAHPRVQQLISGYVDELNLRLPRWETVKKFAILPEDLTVDNGALTPSLKVKRRVVESRYQDVIDGFYADADAS